MSALQFSNFILNIQKHKQNSKKLQKFEYPYMKLNMNAWIPISFLIYENITP
jgi:hypothetical protein